MSVGQAMDPSQPAPTLPVVEYAERSDPGREPDKQVNEDACGHRETRFGHLCVVCDGMGGHAAGREAAELALATVFEVFDAAADDAAPGALLKSALEEASRRVFVMRTSEVAMGRPGSTAVAVLLHARGTEVAHIGDSRAYLVHGGQIFRITRDHSIVQELVDRGLLTLQQAARHPDANRITRALGMASEVEAELRPQPVHHVPGDAFVLCSDGLSDMVEDHEILSIVGSEPAEQAAGKLVDLANARGGHDNITVVILRAREAALTSSTAVSPTVAQTSVTEAPATVPSRGPPAAEPRVDRTTEPIFPAEAIPAPPQEPASTPTQPPTGRRRASPAVVVGVVLALAAMVALGAVLLSHLDERAGKNSGQARTLPALTARPTASVSPVEAPPPAPPSVAPEPIPPLDPSPAPSAPVRGTRP